MRQISSLGRITVISNLLFQAGHVWIIMHLEEKKEFSNQTPELPQQQWPTSISFPVLFAAHCTNIENVNNISVADIYDSKANNGK